MGRFQHHQHVLRMAVLFGIGLVGFVGLRAYFIPRDFGTIGFYRAGALDDVKARPLHYAGEDACVTCHAEAAESRAPSKHARIRCEACHGPLLSHVESDFSTKPALPDPRKLCLTCHTKMEGKYAGFPQIVPGEHNGTGPCTACHKPHHPKITKTPEKTEKKKDRL